MKVVMLRIIIKCNKPKIQIQCFHFNILVRGQDISGLEEVKQRLRELDEDDDFAEEMEEEAAIREEAAGREEAAKREKEEEAQEEAQAQEEEDPGKGIPGMSAPKEGKGKGKNVVRQIQRRPIQVPVKMK